MGREDTHKKPYGCHFSAMLIPNFQTTVGRVYDSRTPVSASQSEGPLESIAAMEQIYVVTTTAGSSPNGLPNAVSLRGPVIVAPRGFSDGDGPYILCAMVGVFFIIVFVIAVCQVMVYYRNLKELKGQPEYPLRVAIAKRAVDMISSQAGNESHDQAIDESLDQAVNEIKF